MKKLCLLVILLIAFNLFSTSLNRVGHITSKITVSNMEPEQGEIVEVNAVFSLDKTGRFYKEGKEYLIRDAYFSQNWARNYHEDLPEKYIWEVVYSDSSKIISDKNPVVHFTYRIKLLMNSEMYSILGLYVAEMENGKPLHTGARHIGNASLRSPAKQVSPKTEESFKKMELNLDTENPEKTLRMNLMVDCNYQVNTIQPMQSVTTNGGFIDIWYDFAPNSPTYNANRFFITNNGTYAGKNCSLTM